jgi:[CysO sulfur-carrier protein]-S-L-cysteine hydrolase
MVRITRDSFDSILEHCRADVVRECCGLLAGCDGVITHIYPATNVAPKPEIRYEIAPKEIFQRMRDMRAAGVDLLGIYHSHPNSKNEPSPRDVECAHYPETPYLIVSPLPGAERPVRAFLIADGQVNELDLEICRPVR